MDVSHHVTFLVSGACSSVVISVKPHDGSDPTSKMEEQNLWGEDFVQLTESANFFSLGSDAVNQLPTKEEFKHLVAEVIREQFNVGLRHDVPTASGKQGQGWFGARLIREISFKIYQFTDCTENHLFVESEPTENFALLKLCMSDSF
jgi:hypothetical protein